MAVAMISSQVSRFEIVSNDKMKIDEHQKSEQARNSTTSSQWCKIFVEHGTFKPEVKKYSEDQK